jgi:hypothetical protein
MLDPKRVYADLSTNDREYTEYMTGDYAWDLQVSLNFLQR